MAKSILCKISGHKWDGCKCMRCRETRDEGHSYEAVPGKCQEKCSKCGQIRDIEHRWNGCKCTRCGEERDEGHSYEAVPEKCLEKCSICGRSHELEHQWDGCKCARCGEIAFRFEVDGSREHVNIYGEITHIYAIGKVTQGRLQRGDVVDVYAKSGILKFKKVEIVHTRGEGMRPDAYSLPDEQSKYGNGYVSLETYGSHDDIVTGDIIVPVNFPM